MFSLIIGLLGAGCGCEDEQSELLDIDNEIQKFGETQRLLLMRLYKADGSLNTIPAATLQSKALLAAAIGGTEDAKIVMSPVVHAPTTNVGSARLYGGQGTTAGGLEEVLGSDPTEKVFEVHNARQDTIAALAALCGTPLGVIAFDECGNAEVIVDDFDTPVTVKPIPLSTYFVSDKINGGAQAPEKNMISFKHKGGFSRSVGVVKRDPLVDSFDTLIDFL